MVDIKGFRTSNSTVKAGAIADGYGSIPINHQLFWGSLGTRVLTHPQIAKQMTSLENPCRNIPRFPCLLAENLSVESLGTAEGKRPRSRLLEVRSRQSTA